MPSTPGLSVVLGAAGATGSAIVGELSACGLLVRTVTRSGAAAVPGRGNVGRDLLDTGQRGVDPRCLIRATGPAVDGPDHADRLRIGAVSGAQRWLAVDGGSRAA